MSFVSNGQAEQNIFRGYKTSIVLYIMKRVLWHIPVEEVSNELCPFNQTKNYRASQEFVYILCNGSHLEAFSA